MTAFFVPEPFFISTCSCCAIAREGSGSRADGAMLPGRGLRERRRHTRALRQARPAGCAEWCDVPSFRSRTGRLPQRGSQSSC